MSRAAISYLLRLDLSNSKDHEVAASRHADTPSNYRTSHSRISYPIHHARGRELAHGEMTQAQLAEHVGVTRQTMIAVEQGRYSPSLEMAFQIAWVFGVALDEVFQYPDGEGEPR
jgi:putative transcriptional regulator